MKPLVLMLHALQDPLCIGKAPFVLEALLGCFTKPLCIRASQSPFAELPLYRGFLKFLLYRSFAWVLQKTPLYRGFAWVCSAPKGFAKPPLNRDIAGVLSDASGGFKNPFLYRNFAWIQSEPLRGIARPPLYRSFAWVLQEIPLSRGFVKHFTWILCKVLCLELHEMCISAQNSHVCQSPPP